MQKPGDLRKRLFAHAHAKCKAFAVMYDDNLTTGTRGGGFGGSETNSRLDGTRHQFLAAWLDACRAGQISPDDLAHEVVATLSAMEQLATLAGVTQDV